MILGLLAPPNFFLLPLPLSNIIGLNRAVFSCFFEDQDLFVLLGTQRG